MEKFAGSAHEPTSDDELVTLRLQLDSIDEKFLEALRERIDCCSRIALFKSDNTVPMMQPHRIAFVQERAARYASEHQLSKPFLRELYELLIAETCRVEELIISARAKEREAALVS